MLVRYKEIEQYLRKLDCVEVDELTLSVLENRSIDSIFEKLKILNSVTKQLQKEDTTIADVLAIFDAVIE